MSENNIETKICKVCGRELPLEKIFKYSNGNYSAECRECHNRIIREKRKAKRIKKQIIEFQNDKSLKVDRRYKVPRDLRILDLENAGILKTAADEVFAKLIDYKDVWISNYGRAVALYGDKYSIKHKKRTDNGEIAYNLYKNVYSYDAKKYVYIKTQVEAWRLVVSQFVVNYDIQHNNYCWHKGNDMEDNYYKHLYPLNELEYQAVQKNYTETGDDSEETILEIMNDIAYRLEGWDPARMKRSTCGVGWLGSGTTAIMSNPSYGKWFNMMCRSYSDTVHKSKPYYIDSTVGIEWHHFGNFEYWYNEQYIDGKKLDLDKDILIQGNKTYDADTCALVTHYTNTIFEDRGFENNIVKNEQTGKYDTSMHLLGKKIEIGSFATEEEAQEKYFEYKTEYIQKFAKKNKEKIPRKVYDAMMMWDVKAAY